MRMCRNGRKSDDSIGFLHHCKNVIALLKYPCPSNRAGEHLFSLNHYLQQISKVAQAVLVLIFWGSHSSNLIFSQTVIRGPYLQSGTTNSMIVRWRTDAPTNSKILFGTDLFDLKDTIVDFELLLDHEVFIPGLTPNTKYYYALGDSNGLLAGGTAEYFFKTSPVNRSHEPVRAWILGDCGTGTDQARAVRDAYENYVGSDHTDLILLLGDNAYESGLDSEYQQKFFQNMYEDQLIQSVLWPSPGNHDLRSAKSATQSGPYYDIFTLPTNAEAGGLASGTEAYYSFDYANIHFVSLDSDDSGHDPTDPMLVWMDDDLHSTEQDWKIVFLHHPPYSKGSHDSDSSSLLIKIRENFVPIWEAAGVDLVIAGHSHSYERSFLIHSHHGFSPTLDSSMVLDPGDGQQGGDGAYQKYGTGPDAGAGTVYVVAGSSGKLSGGTFDHPAMFTGFKAMGSVSLEVTGLQLDLKFIDSEGSILDFFTITKREPVGNPPVVSLTSPADSTHFLSPRNVSLVADAADVDGTIEKVEFFANDSLIGTVQVAPYALNWAIPSNGKFKLTARATDNDGNMVTSSRVHIEVGLEVCAQINDSANDAEERPDGGVNTSSTDLELVVDPNHGDQVVGMRFVDLNIPKNVVIDRAYIQFTVDETNNISPCSLIITGEANGNPLPFMTHDFNITNRSRTNAQVIWKPVDWDMVGKSGVDQKTSDLSPVLQEILNHAEYSDSSAIVLFIDGEGKRVAESFDGSVESSPKLWVNYSVYDCPVQELNIGDHCDDGDPSTINDTTDANCNCAGVLDTCVAISDVDGDGICTELDCDDNDSTVTYQPGDPCDDGDSNTTGETIQPDCSCGGGMYPPVVTISDPQDGSFYATPKIINISADATDADGIITQIEFFVDGVSLQIDSAEPFTVDWMIPSAGNYSITAVATDNDNNTTESSPVNIQVGGFLTTTCSKVNSSNDDAEEQPDESVNQTSSDLELVYDNGDQTVGMRFVGLQIPQGARINSAHIQFTVEETDGIDPCNLFIYGEVSNNAETFTNNFGDISGRARTSSVISWSPPDWQVVGEAGSAQKTTDIAPVIQEIVDRREYTSNSAIVIIIDGSGKRSGESYDGSASKAPELCVEYTLTTESVEISQVIDFRNRLEKEPMERVGTVVDLAVSERAVSPISVYPNPANRNITVGFWSDHADNVRVKIVDLVGRARYSHLWQVRKGLNHVSLNNLTLETGVYLVQVYLYDSYKSSKVVISR